MASWDNFGSVESSTFRSTFSDSWVSDAYARDTEGLAIALQKSLPGAFSPSETNSTFLDFMKPETGATLSSSSFPASWDPEAALKLKLSAPAGRVSKRKSRPSKRTQTTFIAADPQHFRQMVQQVTGVRISESPSSAPVLKLEPLRLDSRLTGGGCLPTLDTSAFLLNSHQNGASRSTGAASGSAGISPISFSSDMGPGRMDSDTFSSFPTLESWKVK